MDNLRKLKEDRPVLAICYDFDKTLTPVDMQAQGYIQEVYGDDVASFWTESNKMAEDNEMDTNLAYMYMMVQKARGRIVLTRKKLEEYGSKVVLFPGVEEWFQRIKEYGIQHNVIVEHYIISSGLKEMIEGTLVAKRGCFEKIYASSFLFDSTNVPIWPAQVINYTNKTQFLFRIEKGVLDINDSGVNDYFSAESIRVPFRNMIYIGDSDTDIPCMKLVNSHGGHSIGVFSNDTLDKTKVYKMLRDNRIKFFVPANYSENSELDVLVKAIIDRTEKNEQLENIHYRCQKEQAQNDATEQSNENKRKRLDLILSLNGSRSFATTHALIDKLSHINPKDWIPNEIDMLLNIAISNTQIKYIINDLDIKYFYKSLISELPTPTDSSKKIELLFEKE